MCFYPKNGGSLGVRGGGCIYIYIYMYLLILSMERGEGLGLVGNKATYIYIYMIYVCVWGIVFRVSREE